MWKDENKQKEARISPFKKQFRKTQYVKPQLVERSLPTPDIWCSNPVIGILLLSIVLKPRWKDEYNEKEARKQIIEHLITS